MNREEFYTLRNLFESGELSEQGLQKLEPYRVDGAVIMAAGPATRFVPLSLEKPKGLFEVRGETLIERQIRQLMEAGITDITVVLGYKKEMFFYLKDKYPVRLIINPSYNVRSNIESLLLSEKYIRNSYICCCDSYYTENPFHLYEYESYYAGYPTKEKTRELYALTDSDGRISKMQKGLDGGDMLLGHAFWQTPFAEAFFALAKEDREVGIYNDLFWEWLVMDHIGELPAFYYHAYAPGTIFEFDYYEELRRFDEKYIGSSNSRIMQNICGVFSCEEKDIIDFRTVHEGLTNTSFIFRIGDTDYIYRHPGDGTDQIIDRAHERCSLEIARDLGVDPTYIYMDVHEGWKISKFVHHFRVPDYADFEDSKKIIGMLKKLHASGVRVDYGLKPYEDALYLEELLKKKDAHCFEEFEGLKEQISSLWERVRDDGIEPCFCHGDTYKPNWMLCDDGSVILIDWEYSGFSDPGIDVGYYIVDAMYDLPEAKRFIRAYIGEEADEKLMFHYLVYVALIAYYWFVWAMYRESCGAVMGEALLTWYEMAKKYAAIMCSDGWKE